MRKFLSYQEAKEFVHKLNIKSKNQWFQYCKSGNKPNNIPSNLNQTYKNKGWITWGAFLGTGTIHGKFKEYLSYEETREFVSKLNIKSQTEWFQYSKSENKPDNIPADPYSAYKKKGWISWSEFLNKGLKDSKNRKYMSYQEAREFISKLNLKSQTEWFQYCKSGNKPHNIPFNPQVFYKLKK